QKKSYMSNSGNNYYPPQYSSQTHNPKNKKDNPLYNSQTNNQNNMYNKTLMTNYKNDLSPVVIRDSKIASVDRINQNYKTSTHDAIYNRKKAKRKNSVHSQSQQSKSNLGHRTD